MHPHHCHHDHHIIIAIIRMGMVILSFTIKDMKDEVEHLESLGKAQTAVVRLWGQHQPKQKEPEKQKKHTKEVILIPRNKVTTR